MNDESTATAPTTPSEPSPQAVLTAGGLIRQAREASGLHIAALAVSLKVPVRKLELLESDRLDTLHDGVFVRALAASVCRSLRIDPTAVLDKLPQSATPALSYASGLNAAFQSPGAMQGLSLATRLRHPLVLAVLALLLGAVVLGFLPELQRALEGSLATHSAAPVAPPTPPVTVAPAPAPDTSASAALADGASGVVLETVVREPAPAASAAALALASGQTALDPNGSALLVPGSAPGLNPVLSFKARAATWIEVTDAQGVVLLRRTLLAGESAAASGALPLKSVVGRADALEVQVRGKPFDLGPIAKDNVARFEVKP